MSFTFGRELRLCSAADYKQVFDQTDIKVSSRYVLMLASINKLDHPRLGLVVAKKNIRHATGRNRAKRHIRETFRQQKSVLGNLDIVVLVRKGLDELDNWAINEQLAKQWRKLGKRLEEHRKSA